MSEKISDFIISFLQRNKISSVLELSQAIGVSKSAIQYQIQKLVKDNLVESIMIEKGNTNGIPEIGSGGRGRPTLYYRLSSKTFPDNLDHLADHLLSNFLAINSADNIRQIAERMFVKANTYSEVVFSLNELILILNQHHYRASWEASKYGPRIIFRNCPYARIIYNHPELCLMDAYVIDHFSNSTVTQTSKINTNGGLPMSCIFEIIPSH
jgi:predicted ArsR family transcriptional regulator